MGQNPSRGVCPWCRKAEVAAATKEGHPGCPSCLMSVPYVSARCRCGAVVEPEMSLYEVRPDGSVKCCFCMGSFSCQVSGCSGCDYCMDWSDDDYCPGGNVDCPGLPTQKEHDRWEQEDVGRMMSSVIGRAILDSQE